MQRIKFYLILILITNSLLSISQEICKDSLECYIILDYPDFEFEIEKRFESARNTVTYQTPLLADIDNDCIPDIIMADVINFRITPRLTSGIIVISSLDGSVKRTISTPLYAWSSPSSFVVGDVDGDGNPELIVAAANIAANPANVRGKLICYNFDSSIKWISDQQFDTQVPFGFGGSVGLADFNQDGTPEVYIYNQIFNAVTGVKLIDGGPHGLGFGVRDNPNLGSSAITVAGQLDDIENDLELAAGFTTYKVIITNPSGMAGNQMIPMNILIDGQLRDGYTSIGDINGDGRLDIVVGSIGTNNVARLYVYTIQNNQAVLVAKVNPITGGGSFDYFTGPPFIGDITGNGQPSIGITRPFRLITYDYNGTDQLQTKWVLNTTDGSGQTGMTMFDFNQDGRQEIVYRDETTLRIIDGSGSPVVLASYNCRSETGVEYALVGDIDNTGESKICTTCSPSTNDFSGRLHVLSAPSGKQPWAPSRGVWNQYGYHVFNINDNLTVPASQLSNATYANGVFNNFYVQASYVNDKGKFIQPAFDMSGKIHCLTFNETNGNVEITFDIFNNATSSLYAPPGFTISFFHGDPTTTGVLIGTYITTSGLDPGETLEDLIFTFGFTDIDFPNGIYMLVNSNGIVNFEDIYDPENYNLLECNFEDNIVSYLNMSNITSQEILLCDGETYDFFGTILNESGLYHYRLTNQDGCDSILNILQLNVSQNTTEEINIESCESYFFNNENLTQSGVYFLETTNQFGCDSIVTLNLEISFPESIYLEEKACSEFYWDLSGLSYDESGLYDHVLINEVGCDTLVQLELTINDTEEFFLNHDMCVGEEFNFDGLVLNETGTYNSHILGSGGCDSIITTLFLNVHNQYLEELKLVSCEPIDWNGSIINESGEYLLEGTSEYGCDSTVFLKLEIQEHQLITEVQSACDEYYWPVTNQYYTESGTYSFGLQDENGCDSLFNLELMIHSGSFHSEIVETDDDYFWRVNDSLITVSGEYIKKFTNQFGCDSIHRLNIIVEKFRSIWVPNVFSPNFDGLNDEVYVHATDGVEEILKFSIFNRWGALVFELENFPPNNPNYGWTGTFKDQEVNQAVFVYVVHWIGNSGAIEVVSGDITLLRF